MSFEYVLDTWAWFEYFKGTVRGKQVELILKNHRVAITLVTIAELADKFWREKQEFVQFFAFIKSKAVILPLAEQVIMTAPKTKQELREKHPDASLVDAINLTTARISRAKLLTGDSGFEGIPNAEIV